MKDGSVDMLIKENDMNLSEINFQNINQTINLSEIVTKDCVNKKEIYVDISDTGQGILQSYYQDYLVDFLKTRIMGRALDSITKKIGGGSWWKNLGL